MTINEKAWNRLVKRGLITDLSHELPDEFLMFGQWMRAKVRYKGKVWFVSGWDTGDVIFQEA